MISDFSGNCCFDYQPRTRIILGNNTIDRLGEISCELGGSRVLVVSDQGIVAAGHVDRACQSLAKSNLDVTIFDQVRENPSTKDVHSCLKCAESRDIDLIVGLGGGSSMDTAKGCNFLLTNGGNMIDYWGIGKAHQPMLPIIAVPTTAGTGSEMQSFALIADEDNHQKMACGDPKAAPKVAILDPTLTLTQPRQVSICTGIDAIAHAVEAAVTQKRNPISEMFAREAFRLTVSSIDDVVNDPSNLSARGRMLLGASYAGIAIENSMLGAAHAAANPLTAHFDLVHGLAVGLMLPSVVQFNCKDEQAKIIYADLAGTAGLVDKDSSVDNAIKNLHHRLSHIVKLVRNSVRLTELDLKDKDIPILAKEAKSQWTAQFNPRQIAVADFENLYRSVFELRRA